MIVELTYRSKFDAAHRLLYYIGPCNNLHGHTWKVEVALEGVVDEKTGMVTDFKFIKEALKATVMEQLDHGVILNRADKALVEFFKAGGLKLKTLDGEPTCENLAHEIYHMVSDRLYLYFREECWVESVRVWESEQASAIYRRNS